MRPAASTLKLRSLNDIRRRFALGLGLLLAPFSLAPSEIEAAEGPVTVLTATQRREVATVSRGDGELVGGDLRGARDRAASSLEFLLQHTTIQPGWVQSAGQPAHAH